jgi:hypothetical protein
MDPGMAREEVGGKKRKSAKGTLITVARSAGPSPPNHAARNTAGNRVMKGNSVPSTGRSSIRTPAIARTTATARR